MSKTEKNLMDAFAGESQANRKYLAFAKQADKEGLPQVAKLFRAAAGCEKLFFTLGGLVLMMSLHIFSIHANHLRLFPQWVVLHFMPCKRQNQI